MHNLYLQVFCTPRAVLDACPLSLTRRRALQRSPLGGFVPRERFPDGPDLQQEGGGLIQPTAGHPLAKTDNPVQSTIQSLSFAIPHS